jgi:integrative and conjugative element protein (TIGR02256 family)
MANSSTLRIDKTPAGAVTISHRVYRDMQAYRQTGWRNETGGALAGYRRDDKVWMIAKLMHPSSKNKSGRTWLKRYLPDAQKFATRVYDESQGRFTYIGEWHTHPEKLPKPSHQDIGMLEDILKGSSPPLPFLFGLILGNTGKLCFWYQDAKGVIYIHYPILPTGYEPFRANKKRGWW